jgi:hypothetical protein
MAFHFLTLKYKDKKLEKVFSDHFDPRSLLIIEIILSIISLLLIYIYYFPIQVKSSIIMTILISIKFIVSLILIDFYRIFLNGWILRYLIGSFYLLSPLIIILLNINISILVFVLFIQFI